MAARIVWWVLTLGILAVFHLSVTQNQTRCRYSHGCLICKYRKATKDNCLVRGFCFTRNRYVKPRCIKFDHKEEEFKLRCRYSHWCFICKYPKATKDHCIGEHLCFNQKPLNPVCIKPVHEEENRTCGSQTNERDWPWRVSVKSYSYFCGGVLIDNDWVLTAAHCVDVSDFTDVTVTAKENVQRIKTIFVHPNYQLRGSLPNDVALIQLENDAKFNKSISTICLPSITDVYPSNSCFITGWGDSWDPGWRDQNVTLWAPDACEKYVSGNIRSKLQICVNYDRKGVCDVDDGGPLSCVRSSDGRFVVEGVFSWGYGSCQRPDLPIFYTNIRTFLPWINNILHPTKEIP